MRISSRIFFVNDDDSLRRISKARFDRLLQCEPEERFPQCAGKRVRCALVVLDMEGRKPVSVVRRDCSILTFDSDGRLDVAERERTLRLAYESAAHFPIEQQSDEIIDARHHFAKRRYKHEFTWTASPEIKKAIKDAIFHNNA